MARAIEPCLNGREGSPQGTTGVAGGGPCGKDESVGVFRDRIPRLTRLGGIAGLGALPSYAPCLDRTVGLRAALTARPGQGPPSTALDGTSPTVPSSNQCIYGCGHRCRAPSHLPVRHAKGPQLPEAVGAIRIFSDEGVSGTTAGTDRPGLRELVAELQAGDEVVVWRYDRLGRTLEAIRAVVELIIAKGATLRSLTESPAKGLFSLKFMMAAAEYEHAWKLEK